MVSCQSWLSLSRWSYIKWWTNGVSFMPKKKISANYCFILRCHIDPVIKQCYQSDLNPFSQVRVSTHPQVSHCVRLKFCQPTFRCLPLFGTSWEFQFGLLSMKKGWSFFYICHFQQHVGVWCLFTVFLMIYPGKYPPSMAALCCIGCIEHNWS